MDKNNFLLLLTQGQEDYLQKAKSALTHSLGSSFSNVASNLGHKVSGLWKSNEQKLEELTTKCQPKVSAVKDTEVTAQETLKKLQQAQLDYDQAKAAAEAAANDLEYVKCDEGISQLQNKLKPVKNLDK